MEHSDWLHPQGLSYSQYVLVLGFKYLGLMDRAKAFGRSELFGGFVDNIETVVN